jgi:hypothetical protein
MESKLFQHPELTKFAKELQKEGFIIIRCIHDHDESPIWFNFAKDNKIGYVEYKFGIFEFYSESKSEYPFEQIKMTIPDGESLLESAFRSITFHDNDDTIEKYKDLDDFIKTETILNYEILNKIEDEI